MEILLWRLIRSNSLEGGWVRLVRLYWVSRDLLGVISGVKSFQASMRVLESVMGSGSTVVARSDRGLAPSRRQRSNRNLVARSNPRESARFSSRMVTRSLPSRTVEFCEARDGADRFPVKLDFYKKSGAGASESERNPETVCGRLAREAEIKFARGMLRKSCSSFSLRPTLPVSPSEWWWMSLR